METFYNFDGIVSTCTILDGGNIFVGTAFCHEDDADMASERTGLFIAEGRAIIKRYQHIKNNQLKPAIQILKHLENNLRQSKYFNEKSHDFIMLRRQIRIKEEELDVIEQQIAMEKQGLKDYIAQKDKLYTKIRKGQK
jgi:hypothetical protein